MNSTKENHSACSMISNTNRACYELSNDTSARWASIGISQLSKVVSKIVSQEAVLCLSGDGFFASDGNYIHCSRCHRTVSFKDAENYMIRLDSNRHVFQNDSCEVKDGIHNTKKNSIQRQLYGLVTGYFNTMFAPLIEDPLTGLDCKPTFVDICSVLANVYYPPASYLIYAIQIGTVFYALANIPSCEARASENVIEIDDFNLFQKIGRDKDYPSDGHYIITKDLVSNTSTHPVIEDFSGSLDGQGHSISKHSGCLIRNFKGYGIIGNIIFKDSNSTDEFFRPLVAMSASDHSLLKNVRVDGYELHSKQRDIQVSIMVEKLTHWARIEGCSVVDASIVLQGHRPAFAFFVLMATDDSSVDNNSIINARVNINTTSSLWFGSIIKMLDRSCCNNITAINCTLKFYSDKVSATLGGVSLHHAAQVNKLLAIHCTIKVVGIRPAIGFGASSLDVGTLSNSNMAIDCDIHTTEAGANIAIGAGVVIGAQSDNNAAVDCRIKLEETHSHAAVGMGFVFQGGENSQSLNNIAINTRFEVFGTGSTTTISMGNVPRYKSTSNIVINHTIVIRKRVYKIPFLGNSNRSTLCQDLPYYRTGFLNDNCTLNQQVVDSYVNKITTWNTTMLNTGRVAGMPDRSISPDVTPASVVPITAISGFIGLLLIGCYFRGYKQGKRGRALILYPLTMCQGCIRSTAEAERQANTAVAYSAGGNIHFFDTEPYPNTSYSDSVIFPVYSELDPNPGYSGSGIPPDYSELDPNLGYSVSGIPPDYSESDPLRSDSDEIPAPLPLMV